MVQESDAYVLYRAIIEYIIDAFYSEPAHYPSQLLGVSGSVEFYFLDNFPTETAVR